MMWLGDYKEDDTVYFLWSTNGADGASITRATNGTVSVYKDNGTSQSTAGITDTEDFDSLTGIHACTIDLSADAFYAVGADYAVVLSGATIDGKSVNAVLAHFSIENRFNETAVTSIAAGAITAAAIATGAIDADALAADAVDEIWDEVAEGAYTARQYLRLLVAALCGKTTGGGTGTCNFRDIGDTKNRIIATVDANGNRTGVSHDAS